MILDTLTALPDPLGVTATGLSNANLTVDATFTDDDLVSGSSVDIVWPTSDNRFNSCTVKYSNEAENFKEDSVTWPPKTNTPYTKGIGGTYYTVVSGWDNRSAWNNFLNQFAVWHGSGTTATFSWKIKPAVSGVFNLRYALDDNGTITINGSSFSSTGQINVNTGTVSLTAGVVYTVAITANDNGGLKGVAGSLVGPDNVEVWNTRNIAYSDIVVVTPSNAIYLAMKEEDNGVELETDIYAEGITDYYHALAKAEELVRTSRSAFSINFDYVIKDRFLEPGDFVQLISHRLSLGVNSPLYVRVNEVQMKDGLTATLKGTRFDWTQLAWNVKDDEYLKPTNLYNYDVMPPTNFRYTLDPGQFNGGVGRLEWDKSIDSAVTDYILYAATTGVYDEHGLPVFQELGRSTNSPFLLPALSGGFFWFGIRAHTISNKVSVMIVIDGNVVPVSITGVDPPKPTDLVATPDTTKAKIALSWTIPATHADGTNYDDHATTSVYRSSTNNFATATLIGNSTGSTFTDLDEVFSAVYYWVKLNSYKGKTSPVSDSATATFNHFTAITDTTPPPAPTDFALVEGFYTFMLSWTTPSYTVGGGHHHTNVYAAKKIGSTVPIITDAHQVGSPTGNMFNYTVGSSETWYFWIAEVTKGGGISTAVGPVHGTSQLNIEEVLNGLTDELDASKLTIALRERIDLIDDPTAGLVNRVLTLEESAGDPGAILAAATAAAASATAAANSANSAATANTAAATSASNAASAAAQAAIDAAGALASKNAAEGFKTAASTSAANAATSADSASAAATSAAGSASTATTNATTAVNAATSATDSATAASTSATNAASSATTAGTSATSATAAKVAAEASRDSASGSASAAATSASVATAAATDASASASSATNSATTATTKAGQASVSANNAATSETNAAASANTASTKADLAATSATNAANSATGAATSATVATSKATDAAASATSATTSANTATTKAGQAATSATSAATSETNALASKNAAATSATTAAGSATGAANSAAAAATSATNAATSETNAGTSATAATTQATIAATKAGQAATSATNAASSETSALASKNAAGTSATTAATSATNAANSATAATNSATSAASSATAAGNSASAASSSATNAASSAGAAGTSASNAATSATTASTKAGEAATSASNASSFAGTAATSATNATNAANAASVSAQTASTKASEASSSASAASTSQTAAATQASNALVYSNNAATSATNAANSATAAASAMTQVQAVVGGFKTTIGWNFLASLEGWVATNATTTIEATGLGTFSLISSNTDPYLVSPPINLNGKLNTILRVRIKRIAGTGWEGKVSYAIQGRAINTTTYYKAIADTTELNVWKSLEWDLSTLTAGGTDWVNNQILSIRLDFGNTSADQFEIDTISIGSYSADVKTSTNLAEVDWWSSVGFVFPTNIPAGWTMYGEANEQAFVIALDYASKYDTFWKVTASAATTTTDIAVKDGGWEGGKFNVAIDKTKTYRFILPIKRTTAIAATYAWGLIGVSTLNSTTLAADAYFATTTLPQQNTWYFLIGYVYPVGSTGLDSSNAGVYDVNTGARVEAGLNFNWNSTNQTTYRAYQYNASTGATALFGKPMIHLMDGTEPPIESLLSANKLAATADAKAATADTKATTATASVQTLSTTVAGPNGSTAQYTVKVDTNGYVAGFGLSSTYNNSVPTSEFTIVADKFAIAPVNTDGTASDGSPFFYRTVATTINGVVIPPGAYMKAAFIHDASITNAKIADLSADKINAGTLNAARIAAGSLTADKIDSRGLSIKDANGNVILASGTSLVSQVRANNNLVRDFALWSIPGNCAFLSMVGATASSSVLSFNPSYTGADPATSPLIDLSGQTSLTLSFVAAATTARNITIDIYNEDGTEAPWAETIFSITGGGAFNYYSTTWTAPSTFVLNTAYPANNYVYYNGITYKSKIAVPANSNIQITNTTYWGVTASVMSSVRVRILAYGGAASNFNISDIKLELGSTATPWLPHRLDVVTANNKITSNNATTYIANAAIGSAQIVNLSVDTIKIKDNAVSIPISAVGGGLSGAYDGATFNLLWQNMLGYGVMLQFYTDVPTKVQLQCAANQGYGSGLRISFTKMTIYASNSSWQNLYVREESPAYGGAAVTTNISFVYNTVLPAGYYLITAWWQGQPDCSISTSTVTVLGLKK